MESTNQKRQVDGEKHEPKRQVDGGKHEPKRQVDGGKHNPKCHVDDGKHNQSWTYYGTKIWKFAKGGRSSAGEPCTYLSLKLCWSSLRWETETLRQLAFIFIVYNIEGKKNLVDKIFKKKVIKWRKTEKTGLNKEKR